MSQKSHRVIAVTKEEIDVAYIKPGVVRRASTLNDISKQTPSQLANAKADFVKVVYNGETSQGIDIFGITEHMKNILSHHEFLSAMDCQELNSGTYGVVSTCRSDIPEFAEKQTKVTEKKYGEADLNELRFMLENCSRTNDSTFPKLYYYGMTSKYEVALGMEKYDKSLKEYCDAKWNEMKPGNDYETMHHAIIFDRNYVGIISKIHDQILKQLDYLHNKLGYVHFDIKPGNVLLRDVDGKLTCTLTDFGTVIKLNEQNRGKLLDNQTIGTVMYMPFGLTPTTEEDFKSFAKFRDNWGWALSLVYAFDPEMRVIYGENVKSCALFQFMFKVGYMRKYFDKVRDALEKEWVNKAHIQDVENTSTDVLSIDSIRQPLESNASSCKLPLPEAVPIIKYISDQVVKLTEVTQVPGYASGGRRRGKGA